MEDDLANSIYFQQGDFLGNESQGLVLKKFDLYQSVINRLFVLNSNDIVTTSLSSKTSESFMSQDFSVRDWVQETKNKLTPVFSGGFERQGIYRIFISYPIINLHTNKYMGMVVASIPTVTFFAHYGNYEHVSSEFLIAYDKKGTILFNGVNQGLVGQPFFGNIVQEFINHNEILNNLTRDLLAGNPGYAVYDYGLGERLTTQYPVVVNDDPTFFVQLVTPTAQIYSKLNVELNTERIKMFTLLSGTLAAVSILIVLLIKWSSTLDKEVRRRTQELRELEARERQLEESYDTMKEYLEQVLKETKKDQH